MADTSTWQSPLTGNTIARTFHPFTTLQEELQLRILSFLVEAPCEITLQRRGPENTDGSVATLTHILPYVCKAFHRFCQNDTLWEMAIRRAIQKDPVWAAVISPEWDVSSSTPTTETSIPYHNIHPTISGGAAQPHSAPLDHYQNLYRTTLSEKISFRGPVVIMPMPMSWRNDEPRSYVLKFHARRYFLMIGSFRQDFVTWLAYQSQGEQQAAVGGDRTASSSPSQSGLSPPPVYFLHMHQGRQAPVLLVQMVKVQGIPNALFVRLIPRALVQISSLWVENNTDNLHYAQGRRVNIIHNVADFDDNNVGWPYPVHDDLRDENDDEEEEEEVEEDDDADDDDDESLSVHDDSGDENDEQEDDDDDDNDFVPRPVHDDSGDNDDEELGVTLFRI